MESIDITGLPPELVDTIFGYISDLPTLHALCLSNKALRCSAEKQLYSRLTNSVDAALHCKFLTTIIQVPRLAAYVKEFHVYALTSLDKASDIWELTAKGLKAMQNLKSLVFLEYGTRFPRAGLLDRDCGVTFQLEKLLWHNQTDERDLQKILEQQRHTIRELSLNLTPNTMVYPLVFPRLQKLFGDLCIIESFLPGSRATFLTWNPGQYDVLYENAELIPDSSMRDRLQAMVEELGAVKTFVLTCPYYRPGLGAFDGLMHGVERLALTGLNSPEELNLLKTFSSLQELVLTTHHVKDPSPVLPEDQKEVANRLFRDCPKLRLVDIKHDWNRLNRVRICQRWERGKDEPIELTNQDVMEGRFW